nr:RNA-directed DNA polymerase, eukaryota [Tanacetum cinerariifolium]
MQKISKSVFVTNFPEDSTARDLWKVCSSYGTVVDVFIPFKRSKSGKRFAFVRFIKIRVKELDDWFPNFQENNEDDISSDGESQEGNVANKADNNESDVDRVSESSFMHENEIAHKDVNGCRKGEVGSHSEDPFNIYGILDGQKKNVCNSCSDEPKFPPGFTPDNNDQEKNVEENIKDITQCVQSLSNKLNDRCSNHGFSSQRSMNSHSQKSKVGGSILDIMDELVTVCQTIGLGNKAKWRWIKELCQKHRINFAFIQETKAESISLHTIKDLWGNQMFDHAVGSSVGCSGGILCMWNPNMFVKEQVSTCDYFVALMGTWAPTSSKLLIISVYALQELNERRDLWDYLCTFIDRWEGDTVIMAIPLSDEEIALYANGSNEDTMSLGGPRILGLGFIHSWVMFVLWKHAAWESNFLSALGIIVAVWFDPSR